MESMDLFEDTELELDGNLFAGNRGNLTMHMTALGGDATYLDPAVDNSEE